MEKKNTPNTKMAKATGPIPGIPLTTEHKFFDQEHIFKNHEVRYAKERSNTQKMEAFFNSIEFENTTSYADRK